MQAELKKTAFINSTHWHLALDSSHKKSRFLHEYMVPGSIRVYTPNGISLGSSVFVGITVVTKHRQTHRPRYTLLGQLILASLQGRLIEYQLRLG